MSDFRSQREIELFLLENTTYDIDLLFRTKSYGQIINMCRSIQKAMKTYPKEIIDYLRTNPIIACEYSEGAILTMNYNELVELRKKLGIKKSRKKVSKTEPATSTSQKAIDSIKSTPTNQLCIGIMQSNEIEADNDRDLQILSDEEISQMYPGEYLTDEALAKRGIKRYTTRDPQYLSPEEERRIELINQIFQSQISIGGIPLTEDYLHRLDEFELTLLSDIAINFKKENPGKRLKK